MAEFEPQTIEYDDPGLTRVKPTTKFYLDATGRRSKDPKVLALFTCCTKSDRDKFISGLIKRGRIKDVSELRMNAYGDLLKVK